MIHLLRITITLWLTANVAHSQNSSARYFSTPTPPSNIERYNVDYALKNYVFANADSTILEQIDLESIEYLRSDSENVEVLDNNTGQVVILFYKKKKSSTIVNERTTTPVNF